MRIKLAGFTLLEVLVALSILALSAMAVVGQTSGSLTQLATLKAKTIALVLAENRINLAIASGAFPDSGRSTQTVLFNDREWWVNTEVTNTSEPWLRKVEVSVGEVSNKDYTLVSVISYRGQY